MDCEFFEESYYFSQFGPQGESVGNDLSWLTYPIRMDPPEQVVSSSRITPVLLLSTKHPNEPEVTSDLELFVNDMPS